MKIAVLCVVISRGKNKRRRIWIYLYMIPPPQFFRLCRAVGNGFDRGTVLRKICLIAAGLLVACATVLSGGPAAARAAALDCTLFVDLATGEVLRRDGDCDRRVTPMSTFKLPLALMGFDAGILAGPRDPVWQYREEFDAPKRARKPVDPTIWQTESIVWYSQELTRKLGRKAFARYVTAFDYGNGDVSGLPGKGDGLTHSWLGSSLAISADEQAGFIRRMLLGSVPVSAHAQRMTLAIMPVFESDGWTVRGKTGSGWDRGREGRYDRSRPVGWFVGWAERRGRTLVFVRLRVGDGPIKGPLGLRLRDEFLRALPAMAKSL